MEFPKGVILLDSLGDLEPENESPILVCGSHCGGNRDLASNVKNCNVQAVFLNSAGIGKNSAGIRGLEHYNEEYIMACAVDHNSAEIGIALDTWESGIISRANEQAKASGIQIGDSVQEAVSKIIDKITPPSYTSKNTEPESFGNTKESSKENLKKQAQMQVYGVNVTVTDSITFLNQSNAGDIVVCGSHGGISAGHYAQKNGVKAVFFNDAGIGKNNAGIKSLESLNNSGILACTVDCLSAEIFNGQDALNNGIITVCNQLAKNLCINEGMSVKEAIKALAFNETGKPKTEP